MSLILFDCSQFITFENKNRQVENNFLKKEFNQLKLNIIEQNKIKLKKINYITEYAYSNILELENKEFIGEFDDWNEKEKVPSFANVFSSIISEFIIINEVDEINVIFVDNAPENKLNNQICEINTNIKTFEIDLFALSKNNFDCWGNIYIFSISNYK